MPDSRPDNPVLRFGVFELDPVAGELRKSGNAVKLQPQPLKILTMLLQRRGEVVTRDEIRLAIWGEDTFVDFDQSLNFCIRQIRAALNDSPDEPIYLQTLHRRGYRFLAPVERAGAEIPADSTSADLAQPVSGAFPAAVPTRHSDLLHALSAGGSPPERTGRRKPATLAVGLIILLAAGLSLSNREGPGSRSVAAKERYRILVMPFENMSGNAEQDFLSDGITEELSAQIARLSPQRLGVIARTTAMSYKKSPKTLLEIGRELGVDYVLEGSVRSSGDELRVTAQLIQMSDQTHLWAESYNGTKRDVLGLQSKVASQVASEIRAVVRESDRATASAAHTTVAAASEAYMQGRYYAAQYSREGWERSCGHFQDAVAADPNFAAAYAGLARCQEALTATGVLPAKETIPKARAAAQKALELDPELPEAHAALGIILLGHDWDWAGAGRELKRALELDPGSADANRFYGTYVRNLGDVRGSLVYLERAQELDPLSASTRVRTGWTYGFLNDWETAGKLFEEADRLDSNYGGARIGMWIAAERTQHYQEAVRHWEAVLTRFGQADLAAEMMKLYREKGYAEAKRYVLQQQIARLLAKANSKSPTKPVPAIEIAVLYTDLADVDNAMRWMEKAYQERARDLYEIKVNNRFDPLRGDKRFQALLKKMGLA